MMIPAIHGHQSIRPVSGLRFAAQTAVLNTPEKPVAHKKPHWIYTPIIKIAAFFFTHPNNWLSRTIKWFIYPYLRNRHLKFCNPITDKPKFKAADGLQLQGYWMPSRKAHSNKTIVLGHGYTGSWREVVHAASKLSDRGFNIFMFDFRGHGDSQGRYTTIGFNEGLDVAAAVKYVKQHYPKQAKHLSYMGHSMGTACLMLTPKSLARHPDELNVLIKHVDAIVLDAPFDDLGDMIDHFMNFPIQFEPKNTLFKWLYAPFKPIVHHLARQMQVGFKLEVQNYLGFPISVDEIKTAKTLSNSSLGKKPILVLHGDKDEVIPYKYGRRVYEGLRQKNKKVEFVHLDGADHQVRDWNPANERRSGFTSIVRDDENFLGSITRFLNQHHKPQHRKNPG